QMVLTTGMRVSELVALNLLDFDREKATIVCTGRNERSKRTRVISLSPQVVEWTQHYIQTVRSPQVQRHPEEMSLFLNHRGERLTRQGFWLIIKGYARQAGICEITPHMLRHSCAVSLLNDGMTLRSVQETMGHAHIGSTQMYSRLTRKRKE
ncbi:MAG: tyrosine-type recombinase/integrase, partial [Chloroflexota bacterium]|nr:tyrosine-type recombinase/integrase [Chloroflexota bacterium]